MKISLKLKKFDAIEVGYENGPFRHLDNRWRFEKKGKDKCLVHFMIDFEFSSPLLQKIMQPLFHQAVQKMISAFEKRAEQLYGKK
jgi:coenzyme Q-binding protein COQ10